MRIAIVGVGYVGLVTGACLAEMGNSVACIDVDPRKIEELRQGRLPIYEPGLQELVQINVAEQRLSFHSDLESGARDAEILMVAVGTPASPDGAADLSAVFAVVDEVARRLPGKRILVTKSTVPVGTTRGLADRLRALGRDDIALVHNPEFLKQGDAVNDFLRPDRVVIGSEDEAATLAMQELYAPFLRTGNRVIVMDIASAEMTKYAANCFLATKISFMNEMSRLCETLGADIEMVRVGISSDNRIGDKFLFAGLGFGGSCFPKDLKALTRLGESVSAAMPILRAVDQINEEQSLRFFQKVSDFYAGDLAGKRLALWGLAFKPRTDDIRQAPALALIDLLLQQGAVLQVFDPQAMGKVRDIYGDRLAYCSSAYAALDGVDGLVIATEWNEFRRPDFESMRARMRRPIIFDGRNLFDPDRIQALGFSYHCVGRPDSRRTATS